MMYMNWAARHTLQLSVPVIYNQLSRNPGFTLLTVLLLKPSEVFIGSDSSDAVSEEYIEVLCEGVERV